jgi:Ca-activated chloride channel family protein
MPRQTRRTGRYGLLLLATVLSVAVQGTVDPGAVQQVIVTGLAGAGLLLAFRAANLTPRLIQIATALALAALAVALARPEATIAVPSEQASVVLVTDHSGSMQASDVAPSRLAAVKTAAERFLDRVPARVKVGAVAFDHRAAVLEAPTADRAPVRQAIRNLEPSGGTATGEALTAALDLIRRGGGERPPAAVVLISDGESTHGREPLPVAEEAGRLGVPVYTVALGTADGTVVGSDGVSRPVPPDPQTMQAIADASGGRSFAVDDADALATVYERLGSQVATEREPREITAAFAGGALVFVAGGALLSLHWFRRLV